MQKSKRDKPAARFAIANLHGADSPTISKIYQMKTEQIETIKDCLQHEYAVGGCAGMGESMAASVGLEQEYNDLIMQLSRCSNTIIAGLDGSGYFSPTTGAYNQFNIKIGQKETAQVYDARLKFVLPYAVQAWIENEPLRLYFVQYKPKFYENNEHRQQVLGTEHQIATSLKKHMKTCLVWLKSDWIVSLQINYALGEIVIPKSE
jgi:hypothetical protein